MEERKVNMKYIIYAALFIFTFPFSTAQAAPYDVDHEKSSISFSGVHAGNEFKGQFETWAAIIDFDANDLTKSKIEANFDLSTAKTGNAMYDGTLPQSDWFDTKNHPQGKFVSTTIVKKSDGAYTAEGNLTLRDKSLPINFDFTLSDLTKPPVIVKATIPIKRLDYSIGLKSDPKSEWVSETITVNLDITAQPK